jgi:hypothetical protein
MKLTKSRRDYTCHKCKATIHKGDMYGRKSIALRSTIHPDGQNAPNWAWETTRLKVEWCETCAAQ